MPQRTTHTLINIGTQRPVSKTAPKLPKPQDFMHHFDDVDITEAEKIEYLTCLFEIMRGFVDLGFEVNVIPQTDQYDIESKDKRKEPTS